MPKKVVKILFYGINGTGLGHNSRLLNIARAAREMLHGQDPGLMADFQFITTSEAPQVAWDFPVYKLPSKTVVGNCDTDNRAFAAQSQFFISNLTALIRPDILVMDTMPQGSFGEFLQLRNFCLKTVFINRHKKDEASRDPAHQSHLPFYDLILTPDSPENEGRYLIPNRLRQRNVFTGVIHGYRPEEALSSADIRARYGARPDQALIYVSAGGGGDSRAAEDLRALVTVLADAPENFLLVGYGPLYRGEMIYRPNVVPLTSPDVSRIFGGLDLAFSAAGYNTYNELLAAGVPTAFFFQEKGMDDQGERVRLGAAKGWNRVLADLSPEAIRNQLGALKDPAVAQAIRQRLAARTGTDGAQTAAAELLRLHGRIKFSPVDISRLNPATAPAEEMAGEVELDVTPDLVSEVAPRYQVPLNQVPQPEPTDDEPYRQTRSR